MSYQGAGRRKIHTVPRQPQNQQPYNLCLDACRSLPGNQDVFSQLYHALASTGTLQSDLLS